ncbi:nuclear GTP-binding protein nug1 [Xanthoria parietina]
MVNKPGKPKSKRTPVRLRHKIEKASAAKQRKTRKLAKKNPEWRSRLKKDPGIPNLFPYKDKILQQIEDKKRLKEEEALRRRAEAKSTRAASADTNDAVVTANGANEENGEELLDETMTDEDEAGSLNPMAALLASAKAQATEYEDASEDDEDEPMDNVNTVHGIDLEASTTLTRPHDSSRRSFDKVYKNILASSDIILYVLDARDPNGTRSRDIEREITAADSGSKRLILILNKIDLVPAPILKSWLTYLRRYFPTLPLRASTPASNARTFDHKSLTVRGTSETLLRALKSYAQSKHLKRSTTVGIIGYPNVGKSSVINALTSCLGGNSGATRSSQSRACPVGAEAGITTALREVKLDNKLKLLDSPGIVFPTAAGAGAAKPSSSSSSTDHDSNQSKNKNKNNDSQARLILLNAIPPKQITDPIPAITLLLSRLAGESNGLMDNMLTVYGVPPLVAGVNGDVTTDFLVQVARKRGRLGKGGVPNLVAAAMTVLGDWRDGRIQGWMEAPLGDTDERGRDEKVVVGEWAKEFKLEGLWGGGDDVDGEGDNVMRG